MAEKIFLSKLYSIWFKLNLF